MGAVGDCFDNALMEAFWARMQVELLDRKRWTTRIELANAIFEYLEIFHNRRRRHTSLKCSPQSNTKEPLRQPNRHTTDPSELTPRNRGTIIPSRTLFRSEKLRGSTVRPCSPHLQPKTRTRLSLVRCSTNPAWFLCTWRLTAVSDDLSPLRAEQRPVQADVGAGESAKS